MPTGDFNQFIKNLVDGLKHLCLSEVEILICGDITQIISLKATEKHK